MKMLKTYTKNKYGENKDECKSPAMQNIFKAKEDLKSISNKLNSFGEGLDKIRQKFNNSKEKKVSKVKNLQELVENSTRMNKRKDSRMKAVLPLECSSSASSSGNCNLDIFRIGREEKEEN